MFGPRRKLWFSGSDRRQRDQNHEGQRWKENAVGGLLQRRCGTGLDGRVHLHQPELTPPPVVRRLRNVILLAHLPDRLAAVRFPECTDLLLRRVSLFAQTLSPSGSVW